METASSNQISAFGHGPANAPGLRSWPVWPSHDVLKMQMEFDFVVDEVRYKGLAECSDRLWGKALVVQTVDARGRLRDSVCFISHPEFDGFDELQRKTTGEILAMAIDILKSGQHETELEIARRGGFTLYLRLNGR